MGYSCSNSNSPYNGLNGGYLGLGIDEYGNFLNGTTNTLNESGTTATGDNTASGGGYKPGRIGLRGAGSISWSALNAAYGQDPGNANAPYYPATLVTGCGVNGGVYNPTTGGCMSCSAGNYNSVTGKCDTTTCSSGTYNASTGMCETCASGNTYDSTNNQCVTTELLERHLQLHHGSVRDLPERRHLQFGHEQLLDHDVFHRHLQPGRQQVRDLRLGYL